MPHTYNEVRYLMVWSYKIPAEYNMEFITQPFYLISHISVNNEQTIVQEEQTEYHYAD